ncbi:MAG: Ppx/GppA phosphatase family protein [Ignavibacteriales bacterium]|nr:Ppx/GppA phosphatase family protein [Ignavibacteriales bacterium]
MRLTTIDIGTNTILMLIADVSADGVISPVRDELIIARLGRGVDAERRITAETSTRVLSHLRQFKSISESLNSEAIIACGTSALRDAANRQEFVDTVRQELGFGISILSGEEEAELTYRGAVSEFLSGDAEPRLAVLDIGGGSTELTIGVGASVSQRVSTDVGSVRLTERIPLASPPSPAALERAISEVRITTSRFPRLTTQTRLIGVAGTVTTLAAIEINLERYERTIVSGHFLTLVSIEHIFNQLKTLNTSEMMRDFPQIESGRADIIVAGILILIESMRKLGVDGITVSDRGLRYGMVLRGIPEQQTRT